MAVTAAGYVVYFFIYPFALEKLPDIGDVMAVILMPVIAVLIMQFIRFLVFSFGSPVKKSCKNRVMQKRLAKPKLHLHTICLVTISCIPSVQLFMGGSPKKKTTYWLPAIAPA